MKKLLPVLILLTATACTGDDSRRTLVVYSPHGKEMLRAFEERFEKAHPGVDVQSVDMGSQEVLDRLRSEKANPQADVWWGAPAPTFEEAAQEGLLEKWIPSWAAALPADAKDPEGFWYGTYLTPEVIAYNTQAVSPAEVPRDWDDVLDPKWKGKVLIRDPMASGTMRTIFGMVMDRSLRQTGDTTQGVQWLRRLDGNTREYVLNPTLLYQKLARREGVVTLWDMPDIETLKAKTKFPIDYVIPRSGTPLLVDAVAVVKGTDDPELARQFAEWVGSTEALVPAAREFFRLPARSDVPADSLPEGLRKARSQITPEPLDWQRLQQKTPEWMRYWDEHVRGTGQ